MYHSHHCVATMPRFTSVASFVATLLIASLVLVACADAPSGPPDGWESDGDRWWRTGTDTEQAFRDLSSLEAMGIDDASVEEVAATRADARSGDLLQRQFTAALMQRLEPIFRNNPEEVDSLFRAHVQPEIENMTLEDNPNSQAEDYRRDAYNILRRHYSEPQTRLELGEDVPVAYPDSLRARGIGGPVRTQVYLNENGEPQGVKLIESVHPVLDRIAMRASADMRWDPARINVDGSWEDISSWSRFTVRFATE